MQAFQQGLMTGAQMGRGIRQQNQRRELASAYQSGGMTGLRDQAIQQGDYETGMAIDRQLSAQEAQQAERRMNALLGGINYLRQFPAEQRQMAFEQMIPQLSGIFDAGVLESFRGRDMSDASLQAFGAALGQEAQRLQLFQNRNGDIVAVDPGSGREVSRIAGPGPDPLEQALIQARIANIQTDTRNDQRRASPPPSNNAPAPRQAAPSPAQGGSLPPGFRIRR